VINYTPLAHESTEPHKRLKKEFPALQSMLLLDGLYVNGPLQQRCRKYHWQYMIVLKDGSLPTVACEFEALSKLEQKQRHTMTWKGRTQKFRWINDIEYEYGSFPSIIVVRQFWHSVIIFDIAPVNMLPKISYQINYEVTRYVQWH
jgi:hypothetical protein